MVCVDLRFHPSSGLAEPCLDSCSKCFSLELPQGKKQRQLWGHCVSLPVVQGLENHHCIYFVWFCCFKEEDISSPFHPIFARSKNLRSFASSSSSICNALPFVWSPASSPLCLVYYWPLDVVTILLYLWVLLSCFIGVVGFTWDELTPLTLATNHIGLWYLLFGAYFSSNT